MTATSIAYSLSELMSLGGAAVAMIWTIPTFTIVTITRSGDSLQTSRAEADGGL